MLLNSNKIGYLKKNESIKLNFVGTGFLGNNGALYFPVWIKPFKTLPTIAKNVNNIQLQYGGSTKTIDLTNINPNAYNNNYNGNIGYIVIVTDISSKVQHHDTVVGVNFSLTFTGK